MGSYLSRKATSTGGTHRVVVFSSPTCVWCMRAKTYLRTQGVAFRDVDVSRDPAAARDLVRRTGQIGVPVIETHLSNPAARELWSLITQSRPPARSEPMRKSPRVRP